MVNIPEELYPGPNDIKFFIIVPILAGLTIYLDIVTEGYTNPIIFFISVVIVPMLFSAIASGITGKPFLKFFGFRGPVLANLGLVLIVAGLTTTFYFVLTFPLAAMFKGTWMYQAIRLFHFPLSELSFRTLAVIPFIYIPIYYFTIGWGEEYMKWYGQMVIADHFYTKYRYGKEISIVLGLLLSWVSWVLVHLPANPAIVSPVGLIFAFFWSSIWMFPFYLFAESLVDPAPGINFRVYSITGAIAGHMIYDTLVEASNLGYITMEQAGLGLISGVLVFLIGLSILGFEYIREKLPIFGFIKI